MNAVAGRAADPVEQYLTALTAGLHGPARVKARMVQEIHDGLSDATAAHTNDGETYERAAHRAVREFGTVDALIPACQQELTVAQTRRTARAVAVTATLLLTYWQLVRITNEEVARGLPDIVQLLGAHLAGLAVAAALLAIVALAATGSLARGLPVPRRLPRTIAWTGTITSAGMAITTLTLAATAVFTSGWPLTVLGGALAAASHAVLASSARACRACARL